MAWYTELVRKRWYCICGIDMIHEYKKKLYDNWYNSLTEEEKERLREKEERENFKNPTNLNKLAPYLQTPRDMSTSFFKATAGSAPWLFKDRWKRKYTEAPIV